MRFKSKPVWMIGMSAVLLLLFQLVLPSFSISAETERTTSTIGGVEIIEKKQSLIQSVLATAISEWKSEPFVVKSVAGDLTIPSDAITFDVKATVDNFLKESKAPWYMPWKKNERIHMPILVEATEELDQILMKGPLIHVEETKEAILHHARYLETGEVLAEERAVTKDLMDRVAFEIQPTPKSSTSLSALVSMLDGLTLSTNETFSFLQKTEDIVESVDIESRRFFASVLYSVILQAETIIIERHSQNKSPNYLQRGIEVDVSNRQQKDFAFRNDSHSPMLFNAHMDGENLVIELYMLKDAKKVTYSVVETKVKPKTIYRLTPKLNRNERLVTTAGENGYRVTVYRLIADEFDEVEETVSRDFYPPTHEVVAVSSKAEVPETSGDNEKDLEKSGESSSNDSKYADNKDSNGKENDSSENKGEANGSKDSSDATTNDQERTSHKEDGEKEVIYDKGGNVIYDPNA